METKTRERDEAIARQKGFSSVLEMARRRGDLLGKSKEVLQRAQAGKRDLTSDEAREFDGFMDELRELNVQLGGTYQTRGEALEAAEKALSGSLGSVVREHSDGPARTHSGYDGPEDEWHARGVTTRALEHGESVRSFIESRGGFDEEIARLRPGRILRALALGTSDEIERRALAAGVDTAGGYTAPSILASQIIDLMRAQSVVSRAGAKVVPLEGETSIARIASDPVPAWRGENQEVVESEPTFGKVVFHPRSLGVLVKVSREVLEDSANIEQALTSVLAQSMALQLDRSALLGRGGAIEPTGLNVYEGVQEINHDAAPHYHVLLDARTALLAVNSQPPTAYLMNPREEGVYTGWTDGLGQPIAKPPVIANVPFLVSTQIPTNLGGGTDSIIITGDFRRCLIGMRTSLRVEILRERFADHLQYGFLAWMRADMVLEHANAFVVIRGVQAV